MNTRPSLYDFDAAHQARRPLEDQGPLVLNTYMKLITTGNAGTMESNDIMITVEPSDAGGVQVDLTSSVYQQFGKQIISVIKETVAEYDVKNAVITAVDKGALDCTIRARVAAALTRAAQCHDYTWEVRQDV